MTFANMRVEGDVNPLARKAGRYIALAPFGLTAIGATAVNFSEGVLIVYFPLAGFFGELGVR